MIEYHRGRKKARKILSFLKKDGCRRQETAGSGENGPQRRLCPPSGGRLQREKAGLPPRFFRPLYIKNSARVPDTPAGIFAQERKRLSEPYS
jgi:hypothetical protein